MTEVPHHGYRPGNNLDRASAVPGLQNAQRVLVSKESQRPYIEIEV